MINFYKLNTIQILQRKKSYRIISIFIIMVKITEPVENEININAQFKFRVEEAIGNIRFGVFNHFLIVVSGLVMTNVFLESISISFILPISVCDLNLTTSQQGVLSSMTFAGLVSSSYLWGYLADTIGRHRILQPTLLIGFCMTVLSSLSPTFELFAVFRFFTGFFVSGGSGTIYPYLGEFHTIIDRSRAIMVASTIFGFGGLLLPVIAWVTLSKNWSYNIAFMNLKFRPWRLFLIVCGTPGLISGLCLFGLPESPKFLYSVGKKKEAILVLRKMHRWNKRKRDPTELVITPLPIVEPISDSATISLETPRTKNIFKVMWKQTSLLFRKQHIRKIIILTTLQFWIVVTSIGLYVWFPLLLNSLMEYLNDNSGDVRICDAYRLKNNTILDKDKCKDSLEMGTFYFSLELEVLYLFGYIIIAAIIKKISKVHILFVLLILTGSCGILAAYINVSMVAVQLFLLLLFIGVATPIINAIIVDLFPTKLRGVAISVISMTGRLGSVFGSNIISIFLNVYCEATFLFTGLTLICVAFIVYLLPSMHLITTDTTLEISV